MTPSDDKLAVLQRLRSEGRLSDEEYEDLAGHQTAPTEAPDGRDEEPLTSEVGEPSPETSESFAFPKLRDNISSTHGLGLVVAGIVLAGLAMFGILSWWITLPAIAVSLTTLIDGWQRVTSIGALVVAAFFLAGVVSTVTASPEPQSVVVAPTNPPSAEADPSIPGSLGIYMNQIPEMWNTVDEPPSINRGLIRQNEIGEYDTFVYRFGDGAQVAGAYDPDNDAVYALLVSGPFGNEATSQLYLHVCYMVAPFSQDCIDSYLENGLDGDTLEDFADATHEAEWELGDHTWRLQIGQNLLAIRVYGADAA